MVLESQKYNVEKDLFSGSRCKTTESRFGELGVTMCNCSLRISRQFLKITHIGPGVRTLGSKRTSTDELETSVCKS